MTKTYRPLLLLVVFVCCHLFMRHLWGSSWSEYLLSLDGQSGVIRTLAKWLFIYGPFVLCALLLFRHVRAAELLGISSDGIGYYFLSACLCCFPMVLGYAYLSQELNWSIAAFFNGALYPGLFEEIIFRAVLFGALFRYCGWGFIPAALVSSLIFGVGHLYQSADLLSASMLMAFMAVAGSWFAWLYCECGYRVWFPAGMHVLMNGAYGFFTMSGGAMGDSQSNLFKATAIILSIIFVQWVVKRNKAAEVTKYNLWRNTKVSTAQEKAHV